MDKQQLIVSFDKGRLKNSHISGYADKMKETSIHDNDTFDAVYIQSCDEYQDSRSVTDLAHPSDYAVACGFKGDGISKTSLNDFNTVDTCLRSVDSSGKRAYFVDKNGDIANSPVESIGCRCLAVRPVLRILKDDNLDSIEFGDYIELGEFPQDKVEQQLMDQLESLFEQKSTELKSTGKYYYGGFNPSDLGISRPCLVKNFEYTYKGKNYVRVLSAERTSKKDLKNVWYEVQPIRWKVIGEGPSHLHKGKPDIVVRTERAIISGVPLFEPFRDSNRYLGFWQNTMLRAYLNSYDLEQEIRENHNGRIELPVPAANSKFSKHGFLQEAFNTTQKFMNGCITKVEKNKQPEDDLAHIL